VTDYFLTKSGQHPRIKYIDMSAREYVVPFPLYYRLGDESLYDIAYRFMHVLKLSDPALLAAPIHGFNAVLYIGIPIGMILAHLGLPISEAVSLLDNPDAWSDRLNTAAKNPELTNAVRFITKHYKTWSWDRKAQLTQSYRTKIAPFLNDPRLQAICCAPEPGISWAEVIKKRQIVLLDFRHMTNEQKKSFLLLWTLKHFLTFMKSRGTGYTHPPITLVIDELKALFTDPHSEDGDSAFANELTELIDVYARNYRIWPVFATQDPLSFGEKSQQSLLGLGTHIIGPVNNTNAALTLARALLSHDPLKVKSNSGWTPVYYPLEEQVYLSADRIKALKPFHFLVRPALSEGAISREVYPIRIDRFDRNQWPDNVQLTTLRAVLARSSGVPVSEVLEKIAALRLPERTIPPAVKRSTMRPHVTRHHIPQQDSDDDVS